MKHIIYKLFSVRILALLGLIFAIAIAVATFIEYYQGLDEAWYLIYDAIWFEFLLAYIAVGSVVNIFYSKLYRKGKIGIMLFHLSIAVIIIGAGITRFTGETGNVGIREGSSSDTLQLAETVLNLQVIKDGSVIFEDHKSVRPNKFNQDYYDKTVNIDGNELKVQSEVYAKGEMQYPVTKFRISDHGEVAEAFVYHYAPKSPTQVNFNDVSVLLSVDKKKVILPFKIMLDSFIVEHYPGSQSPSSFISYVRVNDPERNNSFDYSIYMNHILKYRGYRFFQASYDEDELGTVLAVNHDPVGSTVTYLGYLLLALGMLKALTDKKSRFLKYLGKVRNTQIILIGLLLSALPLSAKAESQITPEVAKMFGKVWVQTNEGRIKPMNTFAGDLLRKVSRKSEEKNRKAEGIILEIIRNPSASSAIPFIYKSETGIPFLDNNPENHIAYNDLFTNDGKYILQTVVQNIYRKQASERTKTENNILALDERANIFNMLRQGRLINLFPLPGKAADQWVDLRSVPDLLMSADSLAGNAFSAFYMNFFSNDPEKFKQAMDFVDSWQKQFASDILPSDRMRNIELLYNKLNVFERLSLFYGLISFVFLIVAIVAQVNRNKLSRYLSTGLGVLLIAAAVFHGFGLLLRGIMTGHVPVSNGYETMIFISWISMLIGIYFFRKSDITFALLGLLSASALMVAHLSFMNPQITPLVPVLKSVWLNIHVTVITSSYAFLGGSAMLGLITLLLMSVLTEKNAPRISGTIRQLIVINRMILIPGLYLITIGCFLGGVWANQSWGKYWGWDPKETWCLVSVLVYSLVAHFNHLPGLKGSFYYVAGSLLAFSTILMTYFGVNYFLGGMHSYAGGGSIYTLPSWIFYVVILLIVLLILSYNRYKKVYAEVGC
ncbi:cytochrome c biogenesis protein CcsA [Saccharicrinis sp. FJH54]|uniref:cytochrome c biogenesis protein n=1 Tax=Saccharicrinis sp. FJH54 TaxID=3344665 RepID=UPI0035D448B0